MLKSQVSERCKQKWNLNFDLQWYVTNQKIDQVDAYKGTKVYLT